MSLETESCHLKLSNNLVISVTAIVVLKGLRAWSNFISALDTGIKAYCIILLRTHNNLMFQLADYLRMRWRLLNLPSLYMVNRIKIFMRRAEETIEQLNKS